MNMRMAEAFFLRDNEIIGAAFPENKGGTRRISACSATDDMMLSGRRGPAEGALRKILH
jgi:hypothetical protein